MINRSLFASTVIAVALSFVATPSHSCAQATNAPTVPDATPAAAPAAAPTPAPAPAVNTAVAPAAPEASGERPTTYTIAQGDTLWSISHKFDTSIKALQKLNGLKKHALLHIGQVIKIPPAKSDSTSK